MSGILDSKSRILDAILTSEGRRQIADGTFLVKYATFSDADVSYIPDKINGHVDPTNNLYIESCNLPQDQIIFEANDTGKIVPFRDQYVALNTSKNQIGNTSGSIGQGTLSNGSLIIYQTYHGRRIQVNDIYQTFSDAGKGIVYSDFSGLTGSILIDPALDSGLLTSSFPIGGPYVSYIGTKNGLKSKQFASSINTAISSSRAAGGPNVYSIAQNNFVFLDTDNDLYPGKILSKIGDLSSPIILDTPVIGGNSYTDELSNADFSSQITGILTASFENFSLLRSISTIDQLFQDDSFNLSKEDVEFDISQISGDSYKTLSAQSKNPPQLNSIDSLFSDKKLSHLDNFKYLPPIVKVSDSLISDKSNLESTKPYLLGNYPSWGDNETTLTYSKLKNELKDYPKEEITFLNTSNKNNVIAQIFEISENSVSKLDIVDFGKIFNDTSIQEMNNNSVFFVGKNYIDDRGTTCFVNIFTLIFSKIEEQ